MNLVLSDLYKQNFETYKNLKLISKICNCNH